MPYNLGISFFKCSMADVGNWGLGIIHHQCILKKNELETGYTKNKKH